MPAISPSDGPVAVTGSSGYIGSWIVEDLVAQGYNVRACVRDASRGDKVDHLVALGKDGAGSVELAEGDLVTGHDAGESYVVKRVRFDGYRDGKLIEAKGQGYENFMTTEGALQEPRIDSARDMTRRTGRPVLRASKAAATACRVSPRVPKLPPMWGQAMRTWLSSIARLLAIDWVPWTKA